MRKSKKIDVSIIMGSDSDLSVMKDAAEILEEFKISHEVTLVSAHRTPERLVEFSKNAHKRGVKVVIAGAGGAAHLPGMVASLTPLPVIGVPVKARISIDGWDSILSILQMPPGVPVATVALNGAKNAGILAAQIVSTGNASKMKKIQDFKKKLSKQVMNKITKLEKVGYVKYLEGQK
jgi:5-(carboxyamino)imidazole ribonucleotide mutase